MMLVALATALMTTSECRARVDVRAEREDGLYRSAMEDYHAGRIAASIKTFEKLIARSPENTSARFQLACLLQDSKRDYCGAFCAYREYLLRCPDGDKAPLARNRLALCEKELAKELANRHGLGDAAKLGRELETARTEQKTTAERLAASEKSVRELQERVRTLTAERDRLTSVLKGEGAGGSPAKAGGELVKEAKNLLEESDDEVARLAVPTTGVDLAKEAETLRKEGETEMPNGSSLLPARPATVAKPSEKENGKAGEKPTPPARPKTYAVQEGDTLYGVAKRFYGTVSAWKRIRDANKAIISADNRLRVGDTIALP